MFQHQHSTDIQADKWIKFAAFGEFTTGYISDAYWLATLFDVISGFEGGGILPISWYAAGFGILGATLSAAGSTYSHWLLNKSHQKSNDERAEMIEEEPLIAAILQQARKRLTWFQRVALAGDFVSHTGEVAGPIIFVVDLITRNNLPRWGKAIVQCGATLFAGLSSWANVRTCRNNMVDINSQGFSFGARL